MAETRKTFALKTLALIKREVDEKMIADRLKDQDIREAISLWSDRPGKAEPLVFIEIVYKANKQTLLAVSFERVCQEIDEFEMIEESDLKQPKQAPKLFNADTVKSCMPSQPLVFRSLLTSADLELSVGEQPTGDLKSLKQQLYKHKFDDAIEIKVYSSASMEDHLKMLALEKLDQDLKKVTDIKVEDAELKHMIDSVFSLAPEKRKLKLKDFEKTPESSLCEINASLRQQSLEKVSSSFLKPFSLNQALKEVDKEAVEESIDLVSMAAMEAKKVWQAGNTLCFESFAMEQPEISQNTWQISGKRHRDESIAI